MFRFLSLRTKILIAFFAAGFVSLFGYWSLNYLGVTKDSPLKDGAVVVNQEEAAKQPEPVPYSLKPFVQGLEVPWSMVFTNADRALVSERKGQIRIINDGKLISEPLLTFPNITSESEEGLMGLAVDPDYAGNQYVYACLAEPSGRAFSIRVVRFKDQGESASEPETILDGIPGDQNHAGCRLLFGPDKKLYVSTGDATNRNIAQDMNSLGGKILRINSDGSIPEDNPFAGSAIWSLGHRNPQGLAFQPETNSLFETEHGPSVFDGPAGGDEVNIIGRGQNYGWPEVSHEETDQRFISPLLVFTPAVAPSGATFYTGDKLPQFKNNFLFTGLRGQGLFRVVLSTENPAEVVLYEKIADINVGRLRDVVQGPDGNLYILTSNMDGRGEPHDGDDQIYKIAPDTYWEQVNS